MKMDELPEAVFTWREIEDGQTEIRPGRASARDILYEIARCAYVASAKELRMPGQSEEPPSDKFLSPYIPVRFSDDGQIVQEIGTGSLVDMDYVDGLQVKTAIRRRDGKIVFFSEAYDYAHEVKHDQVLRGAVMSLESRLDAK